MYVGNLQHNEAKAILIKAFKILNTLLKFSVLWRDGLDFAIHIMCVPDLNLASKVMGRM